MISRTDKKPTIARSLAAVICAFGVACSGGDDSMTTDPSNEPDDGKAGSSSKPGTSTGGDDEPGASPSKPSTGTAGSTSKPGTSGEAGSGAMMPGEDPDPVDPNAPTPPDGPAGCGMEAAAFCDTFTTLSPGGRAGDLDDAEWAVGRISGLSNAGQDELEWWAAARSNACGEWRENIGPGNDFFICEDGPAKGRAVNTYNDGGGFTVQSMRVRRPFDFRDRTGVISFDVDGRSLIYLGHGIWWNFMLTADPEPVPYQDGGALQLFSRRGIGIEFQGNFRCDDYEGTKNSVSMVFAEEKYEMTSDVNPSAECFVTGEGKMNHVEIHVSKTSLEIKVSDADKPETLRTLHKFDESSAPNMFPLSFEMGYVHLQHSHYNADKSEKMPAYASYQFDNVAFDGPKHPTPRSYQVPDSGSVNRDGKNVGYELDVAAISHVLKGVDMADAAKATLTLNTVAFASGDSWSYRFNGGTWHDKPFDFPGDQGGGARLFVVPVEMGELKSGDNTLEMRGSDSWPGIVAAQIELTVETE